MGNRSCELDMSHTLSTNACFCNLNAAPVTYHTFVADLLVFTTVAFPVLARSENLFTEQTILLRL